MRRFKKFLAIAMVFSMSLGMVACQKADTKEEATTVEASEEAKDSEEATEEENTQPYGTTNLIRNGDCENGVTFSTFTTGGGQVALENKDGELNVNISNPGNVEHGVQIYWDGFQLREGGVYELSFDVRSTVEREIQWRIQVNGGDYHPYASEYVNLTEDMQHISCEFTMEEGTDPAPRLCFNMGYMDSMKAAGKSQDDLGSHTITFDNFSLLVVDDTNMIKDPEPVEINQVKVNQVGYRPNDNKVAIFSDLDEDDTSFKVVDAKSGKSVFEGKMTERDLNIAADEFDTTGDFTKLDKEGTYKIVTSKGVESYEFKIAKDVYDDVFASTLRMYYLQRCGCETDKEIAGEFAHPACHTEQATVYDTGAKIDVSGGWHDAGDYGRYVAAGAKAAADLLLAYEKLDANGLSDLDDVGIPESGDGVNDILNEVMYELDWMLKMQDSSGGVYHKVTCKNFPETVMPEDETEELFVCPISNTATGDFAAVMAMAGRILKDTKDADLTKKGDTYLAAAKKAYDYLMAHPDAEGFVNPEDVVTGEYPDKKFSDEVLWSSAELYKATNDSKYLDGLRDNVGDKNATAGFGWASVGMYGIYAALTTDSLKEEDNDLYKSVKKVFDGAVKDSMEIINENEYGIEKEKKYEWGSNMSIANTGMLLMMANDLEAKDEYVFSFDRHLDYLLGSNPTGYCFVTGFGSLSPEHVHHRPSQVVGKSMPGMLVGGPNSNMQDPYAKAVFLNTAAAKCYADNEQSFSTNEITIYWNSPLVYVLAAEKCKK